MTSTTPVLPFRHANCGHKHCTESVHLAYARYKSVEVRPGEWERLPFHTDCSYAGADYDVSKGCGSPFTTITVRAI